MRVIDLLNKIAKGEKVPKRIKYDDKNWNYKDGIMEYISDDTYFCFSNIEFDELNDEVEIIEEPQEHKIPEKIKYTFNLGFIDINDKDLVIKEVNKTVNDLYKKYNEIIDYLEEENGN